MTLRSLAEDGDSGLSHPLVLIGAAAASSSGCGAIGIARLRSGIEDCLGRGGLLQYLGQEIAEMMVLDPFGTLQMGQGVQEWSRCRNM